MVVQKNATPQRIGKLIDEQGRSALSIAAFCRKKKIALSTFYYWRRKFKDTPASDTQPQLPQFIPLSITDARHLPANTSEPVTISFPSGLRVELPCTNAAVKGLLATILSCEALQ